MIDVLSKLKRIPKAAKIGIAVAAAVALGIGAYLLFGPTAAAATAIGGIATAWGALSPSSSGADTSAEELARHNRERLEREAVDVRREAELAARDRAKARRAEAERVARLAGSGDDGDPGCVLDRSSRRPWHRRGS